MQGQLITALFGIATSFAMVVLVLLAPTLVWTKIALMTVAQNAARVAAITQSNSAIQNEIALTMQTENLTTQLNGQTLFSFSQPTANAPGWSVTGGASAPVTSVTIDYNAPLVFDRALTLLGGPVLPFTIPVSETGTYVNETQYSGAGGA